MNRLELRGIYPPIPTPFDADGKILHNILRSNLTRWFTAGLHGVVVLGSNGEYVLLNESEKFAVWETAREGIPRDRLFIVGSGSDSTSTAIRLTQRAAQIGADAALVITPHYYRPQMNQATLVKHYRTLADASPLPIILYNVPPYSNVDMDAATMLELAQHENIVGVKDSSGNLAKMGEVIQNGPARFAFLTGSGSTIFPSLMLGAKGAVPALANIAPRECVQIFDHYQRGEYEAARQLQLRLIRLNLAVTTKLGVPGLKAALDELGEFYGGPPRAPLMPLGEKERAEIKAILHETGISRQESASTVQVQVGEVPVVN